MALRWRNVPSRRTSRAAQSEAAEGAAPLAADRMAGDRVLPHALAHLAERLDLRAGRALRATLIVKLYITPGSPYARMARVVVLEKGLERRVEIIVAQTRAADSPYYKSNPSARVP